MFVQVIQGHTADADGMREQLERFERDIAPDAIGYLGSTAGVGADGTVIVLARFEDEASARANSERPDQAAWWAETERRFDTDVSFRDCDEVETIMEGASERAGFVQVMQGRALDKGRMRELEEKYMPMMSEMRPDVIGSVRAWDGDRFTDAIFFTSEADARKGEASMDGETDPEMEEMGNLIADLTYIDLTDPWLH